MLPKAQGLGDILCATCAQPSAPAESHFSQVNWGHQALSRGRDLPGQPKLLPDLQHLTVRTWKPMAAGSCGQWGAEGSALPSLLSVREILGPWSGFSPPGLPAPLTDSYGLRGTWPCSLSPGPRGTAEGSTNAYPSSPATSPWVSGEGAAQRRGHPWHYKSLFPNYEPYITSFRPPLALWGASLVNQMGKNPPAVQEIWVGKIPWRRAWQPTPVFLPGESHGQRSLAGYSPWGRKELNTTGAT